MMKLQTPKCPQCQSPAIGTIDTVQGIAKFDGDPSEEAVDWAGETDIDWNTQKTIKENGKKAVVCDNGHDWYTEITEDDEELDSENSE